MEKSFFAPSTGLSFFMLGLTGSNEKTAPT